ncbi:hypothetical protein GCM10020258_51380 [Sphingomonas yabuuchiae]
MSADEATDVCDVVVARPNGECLYKLHYTADGVIVCTVVGFWSIENAEAFLLDYGRFIRQVRHPARPLRILVDLTTSSVMTQALADRFAAAHRELFRTNDKRAYVVATSLQGMQQKRAASFGDTRVFPNSTDAYEWLVAGGVD